MYFNQDKENISSCTNSLQNPLTNPGLSYSHSDLKLCHLNINQVNSAQQHHQQPQKQQQKQQQQQQQEQQQLRQETKVQLLAINLCLQ